METTTIEIREDQREWLEDRKNHPKEPYRSVIDELQEIAEEGDDTETVDLNTREGIDEALQSIESSIQTVESRSGSIERALEDMKR